MKFSNRQARQIFTNRHLLGVAPRGAVTRAGLTDLIRDLGFVQLDSINTLARAHDLILFSRRERYTSDGLMRLVGARGHVFEHWTHDAAVLPLSAYPHWKHKFRQDAERLQKQWKNWRRGDFLALLDRNKGQVADHGPTSSADVGTDEKRGTGGWWDWHPSKTALEYLWRRGDLAVCHRQGFRKYFDLTENVIPSDQRHAETSWAETIDWACQGALSRLGFASAAEIAAFWDLVPLAKVKEWVTAALASGLITPVEVETAEKTTLSKYILTAERDELMQVPPTRPHLRILSPFDPMLRDRVRAEALFGFDYRIEIFVPAAKRQYGYYVFPIIEGAKMIGRIDMKMDRKADRLDILGFWPEAGVKLTAKRLDGLNAAIGRVAEFGGAKSVSDQITAAR